ncbi:MAG: peptidoglycan editing factor PgeF [Bacteroidales bacterium]|nr:peptidoglycan editing factor PgeF [Bacteroidales bacterium]
MERKIHNSLPLYHFGNLNRFNEIFHFVTSREGGFSTGVYSSFNLGYGTKEPVEIIIKNRKLLAESIGINPEQLVFQYQIHSDKIEYISELQHERESCERDAMVTDKPGICLCVKGADCVPLLFYDKENRIIGAAHAGWKGTLSQIGRKLVEKMMQEFGSKPQNIYVGIGPSIGPKDYEVGEDVAEQFAFVFKSNTDYVMRHQNKKVFLDFWTVNKIQITQLGVPEDNIEISGISSFSNSNIFYSHRKSGGKTGRFAAGIMLKSNINKTNATN